MTTITNQKMWLREVFRKSSADCRKKGQNGLIMPDSSDDLNDDDADSNKQRLASLDYPSSLTLAQGEPSAYGTFTGDHGEDGDDGDGGMMILWRCERIIMVSLDGKHGYNRSTGLQWSIGLQKWTQSNKQWDTVGHWTTG